MNLVSLYMMSLAGNTVLPSLVYGVNFTLAFMTIRLFWKNRETAPCRRNKIIRALYLGVLWLVCTSHWLASCATQGSSLALVVESGPQPQRGQDSSTRPGPILFIQYTLNILYVVLTLLTDGLFLWRCRVLYSGCRGSVRWVIWIVFLIPSLSLLASGMYLCVAQFGFIGTPLGDRFTGAHPVSVLTTNVTFTTLTVARLVYYERRMKRAFGHSHNTHYTSIAAMIVESASLNVIFQVLTIIFMFVPFRAPFNLSLPGQTQVLSTLLIIFRVAQGKAWTQQTTPDTSTQLQFYMSTATGVESGLLSLRGARD